MSWQRVMLTGFGDVDRLALVEETVLPQPGPGEVLTCPSSSAH